MATDTAPALTKSATPNSQAKFRAIAEELSALNFEREEIIHSMLVAVIARLHLLMVGPGGSGKSQLVRNLVQRIDGAKYFETALDETSTPDQVLGPPDIKTMVEEGKTKRVSTGMLPDADIAFLDEFFNGNGPVLHSTMPLLNERVFHDAGEALPIPLRSVFAGTNKLNADQDQAALWDRIHLRHQVPYVKERENSEKMLRAAMQRQVSTFSPADPTTITLADLDSAHDAAMTMTIPDACMNVFMDLVEVLHKEGVVISSRRQVEGMKAVVANAWLAGHHEVRVADLSILQHMFWSNQEEIKTVKSCVLAATNPGEKQALELLDDLDALRAEYDRVSGLDPMKLKGLGVDLFKKIGVLEQAAAKLHKQAADLGASTRRIDELAQRTEAMKIKVGTEVFQLSEDQIAKIKDIRR